MEKKQSNRVLSIQNLNVRQKRGKRRGTNPNEGKAQKTNDLFQGHNHRQF